MPYLKYTLLLLIAACFLACETDVVIKLPSEDNKPVINVLMNKDSIIYVRITLSGRVTGGAAFLEPKDAVVQLFEDDQLKEMLALRTLGMYHYYSSNTKMQAGHTYRVTAAIPGQEIAEGTDVVPDSVVTGEMKFLSVPINGSESDNKVMLELKDKAGERNYYRIRIYGGFKNTMPDGTTQIRKHTVAAYFKLDETTLNLFDGNEKNEFFTDDRLFDGRSPRFIFSLESRYNQDCIIAEVSTLTQHSYRYLQTSYVASLKYEDPLTEKVLVYNNIRNGLGIVGGVAIREYVLDK